MTRHIHECEECGDWYDCEWIWCGTALDVPGAHVCEQCRGVESTAVKKTLGGLSHLSAEPKYKVRAQK